jgi:hypothetical protein
MPADLRHSVFGRLHDGGAGDDVGAAVIHFFGEPALTYSEKSPDGAPQPGA